MSKAVQSRRSKNHRSGRVTTKENVNNNEPLDTVSMLCNVHDGHARNFSDASLQVFIARRDNVAFVLGDQVHKTVVRVMAWVWKQ